MVNTSLSGLDCIILWWDPPFLSSCANKESIHQLFWCLWPDWPFPDLLRIRMLTHRELVTMVTVCFLELLTLAFIARAGPLDGMTMSMFAVSSRQLSDSCTRVSSSKRMTLLRCSSACGISPGCKSLACVPDSPTTCQCFLCFVGQGVGQMRLTRGVCFFLSFFL